MNKDKRTSIVAANNTLLITKNIKVPTTIIIDFDQRIRYPENIITSQTKVGVVDMYTDECVEYLLDTGFCQNVCAMNFASRFRCGGGYLTGARAQEEDLCRVIPALYPSLSQVYYPFNKDSILITPNLEIWRDGYYNVLTRPYKLSIVSASAQNLNSFHEKKGFDPVLIENILTSIFNNVKKQLPLTDTLVLGAWGCGVYGNNPEDIARIMNKVCKKYGGLYKNIVFAVPRGYNFDIFNKNIEFNCNFS